MVILWVKEVFNMKIEPRHDYKKPLYIAGLTTMIGATMLLGTACGDDVAKKIDVRSGHNDPVVELDGEAQIDPDVELMGETTVDPDVELSGDVAIIETEVDYEGGLEIDPEYIDDEEG